MHGQAASSRALARAEALARGKTKRDTMRLLKRYLAREIFPTLIAIQTRHTSTHIAA